jgi:dephospho-CoA kinase
VTAVFRLGLTGGIGSGKSTVAALLAQLGAAVLDADAISRSVTATGGPAMVPIRTKFGPDFIAADGSLDRERMRALVFADPTAKEQLETIVHPLVRQETQRLTQEAIDKGFRCLVFDVPLLVESSHWLKSVDHVLVVDCLPETQIQRVIARSGLSRAQVQAIMATQAIREKRLQAADTVIFNDALSLDQLADQVSVLAHGFGLSSG